jgi:hypothetical protein
MRQSLRHFSASLDHVLYFNGKSFTSSQLRTNGVSQKCIDYIRQHPTCSTHLSKEIACAVEQHLHGNKVFIVDRSNEETTKDTLNNIFSIHPNDNEKLTYGALAAMPVCIFIDSAFLAGPMSTLLITPIVIGCVIIDLASSIMPSERSRYIRDVYDKFTPAEIVE